MKPFKEGNYLGVKWTIDWNRNHKEYICHIHPTFTIDEQICLKHNLQKQHFLYSFAKILQYLVGKFSKKADYEIFKDRLEKVIEDAVSFQYRVDGEKFQESLASFSQPVE